MNIVRRTVDYQSPGAWRHRSRFAVAALVLSLVSFPCTGGLFIPQMISQAFDRTERHVRLITIVYAFPLLALAVAIMSLLWVYRRRGIVSGLAIAWCAVSVNLLGIALVWLWS